MAEGVSIDVADEWADEFLSAHPAAARLLEHAELNLWFDRAVEMNNQDVDAFAEREGLDEKVRAYRADEDAKIAAAERERIVDVVAATYHAGGETEACADPEVKHYPEVAWCDACRAYAEGMLAPNSDWNVAREARAYRATLETRDI